MKVEETTEVQEVHYGKWTEKEIVEIDWEARLKEREERESMEQVKRKEKKGWKWLTKWKRAGS